MNENFFLGLLIPSWRQGSLQLLPLLQGVPEEWPLGALLYPIETSLHWVLWKIDLWVSGPRKGAVFWGRGTVPVLWAPKEGAHSSIISNGGKSSKSNTVPLNATVLWTHLGVQLCFFLLLSQSLPESPSLAWRPCFATLTRMWLSKWHVSNT